MTETFYDALGVDEDATTDEIESAYRSKVKETHPDVSDAPDAQQRFKRVKRAKEVLTDAEKRDRYDRLGHERYVGIADSVVDGSQYATDDESTKQETDRSRTGSRNRSRRTGRTRHDASAGGPGPDGRSTSDPFGWEDATDSGSGSSSTDASEESDDWTDSEADTAAWQRASSGTGQGGRTSGYATRSSYGQGSFDRVRVPLTPQSLIQISAMFVLYPVFLLASVLPQFPTVVNLLVAGCTLFVVAYLLSIPEVAIVVFGAWSLLTPLLFLTLPGLTLMSLPGIAALVVTWFPFGLALLTRQALRT